MQNITLDSFELHNVTSPGHFMTSVPVQGLEFPTIRTTSYDRSGQDGTIVASQFFGERRILLTGFTINTNTFADYLAQRKLFLTACSPVKNASGVLQDRVLHFTEDDGTQYRVVCQVVKATMQKDNLLNGNWTLDLLASGPTVDSETLHNSTVTPYIGGGFVLPVILPIVSVSGSGAIAVINNAGGANAYPIITVNGTLTNPLIYNTTTGLFMHLTATLGATDSYVIDTYNKTIVQGGVTNRISTKTSDSHFWYLAPGDNSIYLSTSSGGDTGSIVIAYRDSWIGV